MGFWIAILMTLAVFGSVLWVMPSPREKTLTEMRYQAMGFGLKVRLVDQTVAGKLYPWLEDYRGYVMYEKYLPIGKKLPSNKAQVIRLSHDDKAHEIDIQNPIKLALLEAELLDGLPESSEALTLFSGGISFLWKEKGGLEGVEKVEQFLNACALTLEEWKKAKG
ncbi:MAG: hypothetical protein ACI84K_001053 [Pseudohongiellaceae bacterium]|jgi:hypothetical protein